MVQAIISAIISSVSKNYIRDKVTSGTRWDLKIDQRKLRERINKTASTSFSKNSKLAIILICPPMRID